MGENEFRRISSARTNFSGELEGRAAAEYIASDSGLKLPQNVIHRSSTYCDVSLSAKGIILPKITLPVRSGGDKEARHGRFTVAAHQHRISSCLKFQPTPFHKTSLVAKEECRATEVDKFRHFLLPLSDRLSELARFNTSLSDTWSEQNNSSIFVNSPDYP
jgi:hypothetical protein